MVDENFPQIRVFDYLHYSSNRLSNDSNFLTHKFFYKYLNKYYPDKFHFYLTFPDNVENRLTMSKMAKTYGNITPVPIRYYSTNAFFRNALDWEGLGKNLGEYDLIFNNSPEIGFELLSYSLAKGIYCPLINYAHWYPTMINGPVFANYLAGQDEKLSIEAKYIYNFAIAFKNFNDSKFGVKKILDGFRKMPDVGWLNRIENKTEALYLSVDHEEIDEHKPETLSEPECPIVVFNHRHLVYTGFTFFMKCMERVIELRPELKFKIFLSDGGNRDIRSNFNIPEQYYLSVDNHSFKDYVMTLWNTQGIQVGTHQEQAQWSLAFIDGMFCNLVPLYKKNQFYDEMFEGLTDINEYSFKDENDFVEKIIYMIVNLDSFRAKNNKIYEHFRKHWTWDTLIHNWAEKLEETYRSTRTYKNSEKIENFDYENEKFPIRWSRFKDIFNISDQRPTNQYRQTFKDKYPVKEDMENKEVVFYRKDQEIRKTRGFFKE